MALPGLYAMYVIAHKGYLKSLSTGLFLFVGWWFLLILIFIGPLTLLIAAFLPERKRCPHCRELISSEASRCPKCQGVVDSAEKKEKAGYSGWLAVGGIVVVIFIGGLIFGNKSVNKPAKSQKLATETKIPTRIPTPAIVFHSPTPTPTMSPVKSLVSGSAYTVSMSNVDDKATLYINDVPQYTAKWGMFGTEPNWKEIGHKPGDSGEIDLTTSLNKGSNELRFVLWNEQGCCGVSVTIEVKEGDKVIYLDEIKEEDSSAGIKYDKTLSIDFK